MADQIKVTCGECGAKYRLPIICLIDTPGAYPGIGAEERGQSEAIARNLFDMAKLRTPIISTVVGEGGSGGALAIGVGDRVMMLQYATYSVISPEGCASILWRENGPQQVKAAAEALRITAQDLQQLKVIDTIIDEPVGGAHRDIDQIMFNVSAYIEKALHRLHNQDSTERRHKREEKYLAMGRLGAND